MDACWGAIEIHRPEIVMPFLQLWVELQPDASQAHEMIGWAYFIRGDQEQALEHLRRALELDPENDHAADLVRLLNA
jgi:tetratricopeptide (TPR) repeat protein